MTQESPNPIVSITNDTMRFLGECTRLVEDNFYAILPFLKPQPSTEIKSPAKPVEPAKSYSSYVKSDREVVVPFTAVKKEEHKAAPNPVLLSFQKEIEKPIPVPVQEIKKETATQGSFLSGIPFPDKDELFRAEIYVRDFDAKLAKLRSEALDQIKKLSKPAAVGILKKLLFVQKEELKKVEILNALSTLNEKGDLDKEFFKEFLAHPNSHMRLAALRAISKYKDEESLVLLSVAIKDPEADIRKQALNLVCWAYGDRAIPFITKLLHDVDDNIRKSAIQMCGTFKAQQAISALITLLADENQEIQKAADAALRKITKQNFEFHSKGSQKHKEEAIEAWRFWWINNQGTFGSSMKGHAQTIEKNAAEEQGGKICLQNLY
ncbi:MAG: HEAT repeat domain-containing protein [Candidatus Omnitrophica bacterium]|nr:HEAT repeat domain-containing protein [Candidatus Omnitrophota bacterium]